tara:strand:- start:3217 stop:4347 length:1131 start_codon:yes stop_codon:yes gene_type:complete
MKKLIFRKFLADAFLGFLLLLTSLSIIVWVVQAVNYLDFVSEDGHGFKVYFLYTLLNFPKIFSKLFLVSLFISLFYIIIKYDDSNELSIYWSLGISKFQFINKIVIFSFILVFIQLSIASYVSPKTQSIGKSFIRMSNIDFFPSLIKEKKFIDTLSNLTIYVDEQSNDKKKFKNILIKDQAKDDKGFQIIIANEGKIVTKNKKNYLILQNGEIFSTSNQKDFSSFKFENFEFNLSKFSAKTTVIPKIQENKSSNIFKCYLNNNNYKKKFYINEKELRCHEGSSKDIVQEIFKRFALPFYIPVICLIACMLFMNNKFSKFYIIFRGIIFIFGFVVIFFSEIMIKYSGINNIQDLIIFMSPILLFLIIYLFMLKKNYY